MTVFIRKLYFTYSETRGDPASRFQTAGSQRLAGMSRFGQNVGGCVLGHSALEGRLGRVGHVELDNLSRLLAAQMGSDSQGSVDLPAVTPAAKTQLPSSTTRSFTGIAPKKGRDLCVSRETSLRVGRQI
jgi:hypothetical protein